jgi:8-oxo-dGTP pyrophosphatase MutT (NUDIX family)
VTSFSAQGAASTQALRDAATVLLLRDRAGGGIEVLLVRRHSKSSFMAGAYVFPGGKLDPADEPDRIARFAAEGAVDRCRALLSPTPGRELTRETSFALFVAALRELFEEVGVLLAKQSDGSPPALDDPEIGVRFARHREDVHAGRRELARVLEAEGLVLDFDGLAPWAHWITPSAEPRRFDTRFFLAALPKGQTAKFDERETTDQIWRSPEDAIRGHVEGEIYLPPPTYANLEDLFGVASVEDAMARARGRKIAPVLPKVAGVGEAIAILFPWDPLYADAEGESLAMSEPHPMATPISRIVLRGERWVAERGTK